MNTLYTFGCSYTQGFNRSENNNIYIRFKEYRNGNLPKDWPTLLSEKIGFKLKNYGENASGNNQIFYSSDGLTWSISGSTSPFTIKGLAYGNGKWVAVCTGLVLTSYFTPTISSNNGQNWTTGTQQTAFGGATDLFFYNVTHI